MDDKKSQNKGFRKIPNNIYKALIAVDLNASGYKVVLLIIDRTLGFNGREWAKISLSYFQQAIGLSRQSVRLAIKDAVEKRIIIVEKNATKTVIYSLNKNIGEWRTIKKSFPKTEKLGNRITLERKPNHPSTRKPLEAGYKPAKETLLKKIIKENNGHFDYAMTTPLNPYEEIISYYLKAYLKHTGNDHPRLKASQLQRVIYEIKVFAEEYGLDDLGGFREMIDHHFVRQIKTDYNINHFATTGIMENLFYAELYHS